MLLVDEYMYLLYNRLISCWIENEIEHYQIPPHIYLVDIFYIFCKYCPTSSPKYSETACIKKPQILPHFDFNFLSQLNLQQISTHFTSSCFKREICPNTANSAVITITMTLCFYSNPQIYKDLTPSLNKLLFCQKRQKIIIEGLSHFQDLPYNPAEWTFEGWCGHFPE